MTTTDIDALRVATPGASVRLGAACQCASSVLPGHGISTRLRLEHFWGQVLHETGGLKRAEENLKYSAERLLVVFPRHFRTSAEARLYAGSPMRIANRVYGNRADLGNHLPDDGWRFRGRGLLQITGRANYKRVSDALGYDFTLDPDRVIHLDFALTIAGFLWKSAGCNSHADRDDIEAVTRAINGGLNGLDDRKKKRELARTIVKEIE